MVAGPRSPKDLRPPILTDSVLLVCTVLLVGISLVMVYSTTGILAGERFGDPLYFVKRQVAAAVIGLGCMFVLSRIGIGQLRSLAPYCFGLTLFLLLLPFIPGLGHGSGGASRWLSLGAVKFQPVEAAKVLFVLFLAGFFARHQATVGSFRDGIFKPLLLIIAIAIPLLLQPDFGSTAIIAAITIIVAAASGVRLRYLAFAGAGLFVCAAILVAFSPYRMARVSSFMSPFSDASGKGYQLIQSLIAIGVGQVDGVGLGASQQKLFFLPAAHTDFIFAVIAEELGFIGAVVLVVLFIAFLLRGLKISARLAHDPFCYALALGLTLLIVLPALVNMGVVTGLLPTKGLVLPLVGYGGSSLIASLAAVGLLLALSKASRSGSI